MTAGAIEIWKGAKPKRALQLLALLLCLARLTCPAATEGDPSAVKRILIVNEYTSILSSVQEAMQGMQAGFADSAPTKLEFYTEYLDAVRFPAADRLKRLAGDYAEKYRQTPPDIVIAIGPGALRFMIEHRDEIAPGKPMVFGGISKETADSISLPTDIWGVVSRFDIPRSLDVATHLQPDATRIVVVTGSSQFDHQWRERAQATLGTRYKSLPVEYLSDLPLDGFKRKASELPADALLLILTILEDADGRKYISRDAATEIIAASGAPAYSVYSNYIGIGVVGGFVETFGGMGKDMAALAKQILTGAPPASRFILSTGEAVVDWRQLKRWNIDAKRVPAGAKLEFYDPPIWERYYLQILGALAIIALQSATIIGLIVSDRRRRKIKDELARERLELAHLSRTTQLGALSGSIAHELNQPLTSILANAEVGVRLIDQDPVNLAEIKDILNDIVADDKRAASIILQLRQLMMKGQVTQDRLNLNEVVTATISLAHSELIARQTRVDFHSHRTDLPVVASLTQLQQVILNLMLNAADAMSDIPVSERQIEVATDVRDDGARELSISDRGHGLSPEMRDNAFTPFVSTKAYGLGLGLAICRSIALAHGGTLEFDQSRKSGARVVLTLPPASEVCNDQPCFDSLCRR